MVWRGTFINETIEGRGPYQGNTTQSTCSELFPERLGVSLTRQTKAAHFLSSGSVYEVCLGHRS